jgi:CHAT domain-containing protein
VGPTPAEGRDVREQKLRELTREKEGLERELARLSEPFRRNQRLLDIDFSHLAARLPGDMVVVDLVRSDHHGVEARYEAFVLSKSEDKSGYSLKWIRLGAVGPIDEAVGQMRVRLNGRGSLEPLPPVRPSVASPAERLRRLVWEKIEPALDGRRTVILLPDGALTRVPWAALPGKTRGSYLLEQYRLGIAPSGQHLYDLLTRAPAEGERLLVVGGVRYEAAPGSRLPSPAPAPGIRRPQWPYLPGTEAETRAVAEDWKEKGRVVYLRGAEAGKSAVLAALPEARYVHLATHGFFAEARLPSLFRPDVRPPLLNRLAFASHARASFAARNPMLLSGLVLAGANTAPAGGPAADNGILTAEELAGVDCRQSELVVLSACETGLGDVAGGEGVFGLQRAFVMAGARCVAASLWQVDDRATQILMERFYDNLWRKKLGKLEALRQAQLWLLREGRRDPGLRRGTLERLPEKGADKGRLPPHYWAAFVLSGDWR